MGPKPSTPKSIPPTIECNEHVDLPTLDDYPTDAPVHIPGEDWQPYAKALERYSAEQQLWGAKAAGTYKFDHAAYYGIAKCLDRYRALGLIR